MDVRTIARLAATIGVVTGAAFTATGVAGAAGPTMTVMPERTDPGAPITVTVEGCAVVLPEGQDVSYIARFDDVLMILPLTEGPPGVWTGTVSGNDDLSFRTFCDGVELSAEVDIDNPKLLPQPWTLPGSFPDPPSSYLGTDCPDGTEATVTFAPEGLEPITSTEAIDGQGDWTAEVPDLPNGTVVAVSASCGSVTYETRSYVAGGRGSTTTTSTVATTSTSVPGAAGGATPIPGQANFAG